MRREYFLLLIAFLLLPPTARGEEGEGKEKDEEAGFLDGIHGDLYSRYILRIQDADTDQDLHQSLRTWGKLDTEGRFRFSIHGLLTTDIDGRVENEAFADRGNTFGSNTHGFLYSAYLEVAKTPRGILQRFRVGRQFVYTPETFHLDGATFQTVTWKGLSARGQVGIPVHLYESSSQGDLLAGGGLSYEPWAWLRLRGHYVHLEDDDSRFPDEENNLYGLGGLVRVATHSRIGARASWIDGKFRRTDGRVFTRWEEAGLSGGVRVSYQQSTLREYVTDISPLFRALFESRPYWQAHLFLEKEVTSHLEVEVGGSARQLLDNDDEGVFNREFSRAYLSLHGIDLPVEKVSASLTGEAWLTDSDDIYSLGGDVTWRPDFGWRFSTGYYYSLFKIDRISLKEREKVQTVFVKGKGPVVGPLDLLVAYEVEWAGGPVWHVVETGIRLRF